MTVFKACATCMWSSDNVLRAQIGAFGKREDADYNTLGKVGFNPNPPEEWRCHSPHRSKALDYVSGLPYYPLCSIERLWQEPQGEFEQPLPRCSQAGTFWQPLHTETKK